MFHEEIVFELRIRQNASEFSTAFCLTFILDRVAVCVTNASKLALLVLLLPAVAVQIVLGFTSSNQSKTELNLAISALLINSSANPLIYFWRSRDMRKAARLLFLGPATNNGATGNNGSSDRNSGGNSGRSLEDAV
ncbi:hypothetical protein AWC38_SpisGene13717 [Stylophora pistillata]|uniref:Uncharacterized protein n=1 Tax=Stylophora pistillata TaxID=50429 RepID=A0A2B4RZY4_STYPI|nr:hypothetical protein AWC38_SpisGene13717 [Stylophora pistillata]